MNKDQILLCEPTLSNGLPVGVAALGEELFAIENQFGTNENEALFWTGGFEAQEEAQAIAKSEGRVTFEMTPGGEAINLLVEKLTLPQRHWAYWWGSTRFAGSASGDVHVIIGRYDTESFFFRVELPILLNNSAIRTITLRMGARKIQAYEKPA